MSANDQDIIVKLELDTNGYRVGVLNASALTDSLAKNVDATSKGFERLEKIMQLNGKQFANAAKTMSTSLEKVSKSTKTLERDTDSLFRKFRDVMITFATMRFAAMNLYDIFGRLPGTILKSAGEIERLQQMMTGTSNQINMIDRQLEGKRNMGFVVEMSKNAPFQIEALADSFVKLKTAGIDPTNGSMQTMVDSVARFGGNSEILKRATIAIQQMAGKGVISMEELRQQLGEAVPTAMRSMADGLGLSMTELAKAVGTGQLSAEPALRAMFFRMKIENQGAAAEMMNTWVGMRSRLDTELALSAKSITDAGFGSAMKDAIQELIKLLSSPEFIKFGVSFGQGLAGAVTGLKDMAQFTISNIDSLKMMAGAAALVGIQMKLIYPIGNGVSESFVDLRKKFNSEIKLKVDQKIEEAQINRERFSNEEAHLRKRADQIRQSIATQNSEIENIKRVNAQVIDNAEALDLRLANQRRKSQQDLTHFHARESELINRMSALKDAERTTGVRNYSEQMSLIRQITALRQKEYGQILLNSQAENHLVTQIKDRNNVNSTLIQRQGQVNVALAENNRALSIVNGSLSVNNRESARLNEVLGRSRMSMILGATASRAYGAALSFMGGPIGVIITALGFLAAAFYRVKAAAEAAANARKRFNQGVADEEVIKIKESDYEEKKRRHELAATIHKNKISADGPWTPQKEALSKSSVAAAKAEMDRAQSEMTRAREIYAKEQAPLYARGLTYDTNSQIEKITKASSETQAGYSRDLDKAREALEKSPKDKAARAKYNATLQLQGKAQLALEKDKLRILSESEDKLLAARGSLKQGTQDYENNQAAIALLRNQKNEARTQLDTSIQTTNETVAIPTGKTGGGGGSSSRGTGKIGKKPKAEKQDSLSSEYASLTEENVSLAEELTGLMSAEAKVDTIAAARAAAQERVKNNKGTGLGDKYIDAAVRKATLLKQKKDIEQAAQDVAKVTEFLEGMKPQLENSIEMLQDELGDKGASKLGEAEGRVAKWISQNTDKIEEYGKKNHVTTEQFIAQLKKDAQTIDDTELFIKMRDETKKLNDSLVQDDRMSANARIAADNELYRVKVENIIKLREAAGYTNDKGQFVSSYSKEQIQQMKDNLADNMAARTRDLDKKSEGPFASLMARWSSTTRNMEEASADWANKTANLFSTVMTGGKANIGELARSIIGDFIRIAAQALIAKQAMQFAKEADGFLGSLFKIGMAALGGAAGDVTGGSGAIGASSMISGNIPAASGYSVPSIYNKFANGGIMSPSGSIPLRKYAAGGIANSPQVAIFGEASMNEAYVPLPDGRSIPVSMRGNMGGGGISNNVKIDIQINGDSGDSGGKTSGVSTDKESARAMGHLIETMVSQELIKQSRPGGLLNK